MPLYTVVLLSINRNVLACPMNWRMKILVIDRTLDKWPGLTFDFSHYHQEMIGTPPGALAKRGRDRPLKTNARTKFISDKVIFIGARIKCSRSPWETQRRDKGGKLVSYRRHEFRRNEPWPAADSASARCPAAALIRDTASSLKKIINWREHPCSTVDFPVRGKSDVWKNPTLCMVWIFTRRSRGGKVRPRTLLSERSKLRGHVLPHPKECYGVLGGYQWPCK